MENTTLPTNSDINIAENETEINEKIVQFQGNAQVNYKKLAIEKIDTELKACKGNRYEDAVKTYVANALRGFCEQNEIFAEVLYKTKRTLSDCLKEIMKGCGQHISDIEVYRRATKFYFPDSEVKMLMEITVEEVPDDSYIQQEAPKEDKPSMKNNKASNSKNEDKPKPNKKAKPKADKKENTIQLSLF